MKTTWNFSLTLASIFILLCSFSTLLTAQPGVREVGMTPAQTDWVYKTPMDDLNKQVKFFMRVQRKGNLNAYGTFDYYFKVQVLRPDGSEVWNTRYGFDEDGYSEQIFTLPMLFWERSVNRVSPSFGIWKVRLVMDEKDSKREVFVKEFKLNFTDGSSQNYNQPTGISENSSSQFPIVPFSYQKWQLKGWGIGVYNEVSFGDDTYDKEIKVLQCRNTFSVKEVIDAWNQGHKFGAWLTGPPSSTYKNSNNNPLYLFGYTLQRPDGEIDGGNPTYRQNSYCNNPGTAGFPFDLRKPGKYKITYFIRERDKNYWEESSWIPIGSLVFSITE